MMSKTKNNIKNIYKIIIVIFLIFSVNLAFSQTVYDYIFPWYEEGIIPGIDLEMQNLVSPDQELGTLFSPHVLAIRRIGIFGLAGGLGMDVISGSEAATNFYVDLKPAVFLNIADVSTFSLLLGTKMAFGDDAPIAYNNINLNMCFSGFSQNSEYYVGFDNYLLLHHAGDFYSYSLFPYLSIKTAGTVNYGLRMDLYSGSTAPGSDSMEGRIFNRIFINFENEFDLFTFGAQLSLSPVLLPDEPIGITPYIYFKIGDFYGYADLGIFYRDGDISVNMGLKARYNIKIWN